MDIKKRMMSLLKQTSTDSLKSGRLGQPRVYANQFTISPTVTIRPPKYFPTDPLKDAELLKQIAEEMHQLESDFDATNYTLLCAREEGLEVKKLEGKRKLLKKQLHAVNRKLSELILQKQPDYMEQLTQVGILEGQLGDAHAIGQCAARCIARVRQEFSNDNMQVLEDSAKHQRFQQLSTALDSIKTMREADERLRTLIEKGEFTQAIRLCKQHQSAFNRLRHFACIQEMSQKLNDIFVVLDEQLDVALAHACENFDEQQYEIIQEAYEMLGKTQMAVDQLHMHLISTLHSIAFSTVTSFVVRTNPDAVQSEGVDALKRKLFADLCALLPPHQFIHCFVALTKKIWFIMNNYYKMQRWHLKRLQTKSSAIVLAEAKPVNATEIILLDADNVRYADPQNTSPATTVIDVEPSVLLEDATIQYLRRKFERGPERLWIEIVQKLKAYLSTGNISKQCSYDEFLLLLALVHRMVAIGQEFTSSSVEGRQLVELARTYSMSFFRQFEQQKLEELRTLFEHEAWEPCPVKREFTILDLWEFRQFRHELVALFQQQQERTGNNKSDSFGNSPIHSTSNPLKQLLLMTKAGRSSAASLPILDSNVVGDNAHRSFFTSFSASNNSSVLNTPFDEIVNQQLNGASNSAAAGGDIFEPYDADKDGDNDGDDDDDDEHIDPELKATFVDEDADFDPTTRTLIKRSIAPNNTTLANGKLHAAAREPSYKSATASLHAPIVSNVALNLLRLMGKCLGMVSVLDNISFTVVEAMTNLFGYYFYGVYHVFGTDMHDYFQPLITSPALRSTLQYLEDNVVLMPQKSSAGAAAAAATDSAATPLVTVVTTNSHQYQSMLSRESVDISHISTTNSVVNSNDAVSPSSSTLNQSEVGDAGLNKTIKSGPLTVDRSASAETAADVVGDLTTDRVDENNLSVPAALQTDMARLLLPPPQRSSSMLDLMNAKMGFGLRQRIIATESLIFLSQQLELLRPIIVQLVGAHHRPLISHFYAQVVASAEDIRLPVYWTVAWRSINYDKILHHMAEVKWAELSDLASQHSCYVDLLFVELEKFDKMLENASRHVFIPRAVYLTLWRHALLLAQRTFVEGFANAKQCTHEGRALMQLDYQQFLLKLEKLCPLKPLPNKEYVDAYIKAFYLPEDALEQFVARADSKYSKKHLLALIHVSPALGKRTKQRLLQQFEET